MVCSGEGKIQYGQVVSELIQGEGEKKDLKTEYIQRLISKGSKEYDGSCYKG